MLGATSYAIIGTEVLRLCIGWNLDDPDQAHDPERLLPRLMSFLLGGLRAPLPQHPAACHLAGARLPPPAYLALRRPNTMSGFRSEEHTSELQSLMRTSYAVLRLKKKNA